MATFGIWLAIASGAGAAFFAIIGLSHAWSGRLATDFRRSEGSLLSKVRAVARIRLGSVTRRHVPARWLAWLRIRIVRAGEPADLLPEEVVWLHGVGAICGACLGAGVGIALESFGPVPLGFTIGAALPLLRLREAIKKRQIRIVRDLPFALDLLTLSVEAGLDFAGALGKVAEKGRPGPLRDELGMVLRSLRMGRTREEALLEVIPRIDVPTVTSVITSLVQADRMGTSLGNTLRILAGQLRSERTLRAEKLAGEAPVKMLFPLIAFIFPTVFLVLFGPIVFAMTFGGIGE